MGVITSLFNMGSWHSLGWRFAEHELARRFEIFLVAAPIQQPPAERKGCGRKNDGDDNGSDCARAEGISTAGLHCICSKSWI